MKLIAGLGNIGDKYVFTRHNAGFKTKINEEDIIFVKPTTFMNLSGEAIRAVMDYYKIDVKDIIIIYDDIALNIGKIRIRANGSDGGHNGIKSIISHIGTNNFNRIKIGIGPQIGPSEYFVLNNFPKEQSEILKEVLDKSIDAAKSIMLDGIEKTQNKFN